MKAKSLSAAVVSRLLTSVVIPVAIFTSIAVAATQPTAAARTPIGPPTPIDYGKPCTTCVPSPSPVCDVRQAPLVARARCLECEPRPGSEPVVATMPRLIMSKPICLACEPEQPKPICLGCGPTLLSTPKQT